MSLSFTLNTINDQLKPDNYQLVIKMVDLKKLVIRVCRDSQFTNTQIADQLGMTFSEFNNRLHMKNGTRFFDIQHMSALQLIVGYPFLADYFAGQFGMLVVNNPIPEEIDNVELFSIQLRADAAQGKVAQAKIDAEEDGVIDKQELKHISQQVMNSVRYTIKGFLAWAALHGVQADAIDLVANRKVEGQQVAASGPRGL